VQTGGQVQRTAAPVATGSRVFVSPIAKRLANENHLDLSRIAGTGPNGRIVRDDVLLAIKSGGVTPRAQAAAAEPAAPKGPDAKQLADLLGMKYREEKVTPVRKVIAQRLTESKQTVPHFYLNVGVNIDALLKLRAEMNDKAGGKYKLSVNDFIIKATALALKKVPAANASWNGNSILFYETADISVAVATPTGLITPIVKAAETKSLPDISSEMKDLAQRAKENKLKPTEFQGGTFSLSNLGMFGIKQFDAIINPPQGCILAVGAGEQTPVVIDGKVAIATIMNCNLSVDHRVVDGAVGAEYLAALKALLEDPKQLADRRRPGGYVAAIRAAQLGMKTALSSARIWAASASTGAASRPRRCCARPKSTITCTHCRRLRALGRDSRLRPREDRQALARRGQAAVGGIKHLMKKNKVTVFEGRRQARRPWQADDVKDGKAIVTLAKHIIIATGARARAFPGWKPTAS
jgi:pyruvate dehydrogenase E2 component (dihydrolipoamide acetyltransferase)